jgi:uncharacterized protein (DUF488 family)
MVQGTIIFTLGHSTRTSREFLRILDHYDIELLVDIRHYPGSRANPQFGKERLRNLLKKHHIGYRHMLELGGRRRVNHDWHVNDGWHHPAFRGYADYMQTEEFRKALGELIQLAQKKIVAIMCAEAVPWRCHRSLVGDALSAHGFSVLDIFDEKNVRAHRITPFARFKGEEITYPVEESSSSKIGQSGRSSP